MDVLQKLKEHEGRSDGLFYSPSEKILFWIPAYYTNGTGMLENLIKNLKEGEDVLRHFSGVQDGNIYTSEILVSRRYKSKWYFSIHCEECPKEAYRISNDWTMQTWISN